MSKIIEINFEDKIKSSYYEYAMTTITSRSLPDVRDGLKPVHRRLLYAMLQLKLDPKSGFKKCARVVGDVIGKYHPHGDMAVYEAMVRLAQEFSLRYPLIEGQGNFGSIDGDNAAAMRYTEAKLTKVASLLLHDIDIVEFQENYDNSELEPTILPANFPNLLANGTEGIAVGMSTSIPSHNIQELSDALLEIIDKPDISIEEITQIVKGPDFATGGIIVDSPKSIQEIYKTGKGSVRIRSKWNIEDLGHGSYEIIITEIPYQVTKAKLIEKIVDLMKNKKLPMLTNIRDESAEDIRVVLEPRNRNIKPEILMESLFKTTDLESRFHVNMNVISSKSIPELQNLKQILQEFISHRHNIIILRSKNRLSKVEHRIHILEGLLIVYLNLDEVIRIIREEDDAKTIMMNKWNLSEVQVEAILNTRLRSLRKLEEMELKKELEDLIKEAKFLNKLIVSDKERIKVIKKDIKSYTSNIEPNLVERRTIFQEVSDQDIKIDIEAFVEREAITISISENGWIKAFKGHNYTDVKYKENDQEKFIINSYTTEKIIILYNDGKIYTINNNKIQRGKGFGEPISVICDVSDNSSVVNILNYNENEKILFITNKGRGFIAEMKEVISNNKTGKQVVNLKDDDKVVKMIPVINDKDHLAMISTNRKLIIIKLEDIPIIRKGQGVKLQSYKGIIELSDALLISLEDGLQLNWGEKSRTEVNLEHWVANRGTVGKFPPAGFPRNNQFLI